MDEPWRLAAEVMCRVQRGKTWYSGQRGCILSPYQGQNGNPGSTFTAEFAKQYLLSTLALPPDGGSIEVAPSSRDGFYDDRTPVQVTAVPAPGFELSSWFGDVSGTDNPQSLTMDDQGWVNALFEESRQLISGVPMEFSLPSVSNPTIFSGPFWGYRVEVPEGATELKVRVITTTAGTNVDLYVRRGEDPVSGSRIVADYSSTGPGGNESILATPTASPPLQAGTYFVALLLWTTGVEVSGTLTADVEVPEVSPPRIDVSVPGFTFATEEGMNPAPQIFGIRNTGGGTLNYQVATNQSWLSVLPEQGSSAGEPDTIEVFVNADGLQPGTHKGTITVSELQATKAVSPIFQAAPVMISVTLVVSPASSGLLPGGLVNAASFNAFAAPASIMSLFGTGFTDRTEVTNTTPLPTTLAGTTVTVTDVWGVSRTAELFFVSKGQINFLIPEGTALGPTNVTATREDGSSGTIRILVEAVGPALFSANADGMGVAAASFLRVAADGSQTQGLIFNPNTRSSVPIDLGPEGDQVFLLLFGTGVRGFTQAVTATMQYLNAGRFLKVENESVPVLGAVPQGQFVGLDQINIGPLPRSLVGRGTINILLTADGKRANVVTFNVR